MAGKLPIVFKSTKVVWEVLAQGTNKTSSKLATSPVIAINYHITEDSSCADVQTGTSLQWAHNERIVPQWLQLSPLLKVAGFRTLKMHIDTCTVLCHGNQPMFPSLCMQHESLISNKSALMEAL